MPYRYIEIEPGLAVREDSLPALTAIDGAVFDVDGVLVDVSGSYPVVISEVTQFYFERVLGWPAGPGAAPDAAGADGASEAARLVGPGDLPLFKQAGGFNSDWAVAQAAVLFYLWKAGRTGLRDLVALREAAPSLASFLAEARRAGGGLAAVQRLAPPENGLAAPWDPALVERLCEEHYGGDDWCAAMFGHAPAYRTGRPGLFNRERPLIDPAELAGWPGRAGIYTGRVHRETIPALQLCGLDRFLGGAIPGGAVVTASDGFRKPDPGGLLRASEAMGARRVVYCGDNVDDWVTVDNYRRRRGRKAAVASGSAAGGEARARDAAEFFFAGILGGTLGPRAGDIFREKGAEIIARDVNRVLRFVKARGPGTVPPG